MVLIRSKYERNEYRLENYNFVFFEFKILGYILYDHTAESTNICLLKMIFLKDLTT